MNTRNVPPTVRRRFKRALRKWRSARSDRKRAGARRTIKGYLRHGLLPRTSDAVPATEACRPRLVHIRCNTGEGLRWLQRLHEVARGAAWGPGGGFLVTEDRPHGFDVHVGRGKAACCVVRC
jgi:hypothetical protein